MYITMHGSKNLLILWMWNFDPVAAISVSIKMTTSEICGGCTVCAAS
jgi:hypothetical protein